MSDTKQAVLTVGHILAMERRSGMTDDEAIRFARAIESAVLSKLRAAGEPVGFVDPVYVAGRQRGMKWNAKIYDAPTQEATAPLYAAPQAGAPHFADAYEGDAEDVPLAEALRRINEELTRADADADLLAERKTLSRLVAELNATNGPTRLGEPAPQASAEARDAVLEEAARAAEAQHSNDSDWGSSYWFQAVDRAAYAIRALKSAPAAEDSAKGAGDVGGIRSPHNACMHRDACRAMLDRQQRAADENDREAWAADMIAAGAQHLGGDDWEWDVEDFQFRLWQQAMRRQQRGGDVDERAVFEALAHLEIVNPMTVGNDASLSKAKKLLRAALAPQPAASAEPQQDRFKPPFDNCSFKLCDLPGQCRGEGKCHHPGPAAALAAHKPAPTDEQLIALAREVATDATAEQVKLYGHLWVRLCRMALARYSYGMAAHKPDGGDAKSPRHEYDRGFNDGWDAGHKHGRDLGFNAGVCVSLSHVRAQDCSVTWGEIVRACGKDELFYYAAHVEPEEWKLAGFNHYAKAVFGEGKPRKRAATATDGEA